MNYTDCEGGYFEALNKLKEIGGQIYQGNGNDSAVTLVSGQQCFTYWKKDSKRKQEVMALAKIFGIEGYGKTGGRLARYLLKEIIELPFEKTFWQKNYRDLAKKGEHWHYLYCKPWEPFIGCEFDLKSAYFSSIFMSKSLLFENGCGYLNDGGALERLKDINYLLPKWFRLQLLGVISSWRMNYWIRNKEDLQSDILLFKTRYQITYNAAFNCVHRAILRLYKIMGKIHKIGGDFIKRMHTDSFTLSLECPEKIEKNIFDFLEDKGFKVDVKKAGKAFFFDVNTGFIGRDFVGSKHDVIDLMRENKVKMKAEKLNPQILDRYGEKIKNSAFMERIESGKKAEDTEQKQLELFDISGYEKSYPYLVRIA